MPHFLVNFWNNVIFIACYSICVCFKTVSQSVEGLVSVPLTELSQCWTDVASLQRIVTWSMFVSTATDGENYQPLSNQSMTAWQWSTRMIKLFALSIQTVSSLWSAIHITEPRSRLVRTINIQTKWRVPNWSDSRRVTSERGFTRNLACQSKCW